MAARFGVRTLATQASTSLQPGAVASTLQSFKASSKGKGKAANIDVNALSLPQVIASLKAEARGDRSTSYEIRIHTRLAHTQNVNALRGRLFLPHQAANPKKRETVLVFAEGAEAEAARQAGADIVGGGELGEEILQGRINPTKVISTPALMPVIGRTQGLARLLGPKGLMPNAKRGTVTNDIKTAVQDARGGLDWRADSQGVVRAAIGRMSLTSEQLTTNINDLVSAVATVARGDEDEELLSTSRGKKPKPIAHVFLKTAQGPAIEVREFTT
ncbi:uncharacterized protein L969DRAFT_14580 [Mixia osmundae IAM 14324]|uniref:Ribosomal protein n=1 Tax=Mixia osmundae (strain CBS 9802 / IAM 14324 / JCM 22182 / KY 12970) TaxID=764103 RepID=G7E872_MIXOS|nr:uncharacterized protein L969DRAFT_14580 [Mixia osmundae IAM 14324]KEI42376.1 hypothetical protein L969DRAFT_14580 [Mixia osmundae IAM 14324]GAA99032.1 hypothetical protein E5Q_05721 [Mixia osmundae IAM 14324]